MTNRITAVVKVELIGRKVSEEAEGRSKGCYAGRAGLAEAFIVCITALGHGFDGISLS